MKDLEQAVLKVGTMRAFSPGDVVIAEGSRAESLFFVQTGTPAVEYISYNGGNATVLHTFEDSKVPYGIDIAPEEKNSWGTGSMYITLCRVLPGHVERRGGGCEAGRL